MILLKIMHKPASGKIVSRKNGKAQNILRHELFIFKVLPVPLVA